jgi:hypothetical protein
MARFIKWRCVLNFTYFTKAQVTLKQRARCGCAPVRGGPLLCVAWGGEMVMTYNLGRPPPVRPECT